MDLTVDGTGRLFIADGTFLYSLRDDDSLATFGMFFSPGYPGFVRASRPREQVRS